MRYFAIILLSLILIFSVGFGIFMLTPAGRSMWNSYQYTMERVDEKTYENQKEVEDTCRAMISSYNSDKLIYQSYKDSTIQEEKNWANSAKMRANQTASTYNNYILKNKYVWKHNIPSDIYLTLEYLI